MNPFEEDITNPECDEVYYQTPEELKVKNNPDPDVVHDDSLPSDDEDEKENEDHHEDDHHHDDCHHFGHHMTPIEAIRKIKSDPATVSITKLNGKYYIDHNDLRCYMDACGETNYECALKNIISANRDDSLSSDNIGIVMSESDLLKLDPETKSTMESSDVNFEVYGD